MNPSVVDQKTIGSGISPSSDTGGQDQETQQLDNKPWDWKTDTILVNGLPFTITFPSQE